LNQPVVDYPMAPPPPLEWRRRPSDTPPIAIIIGVRTRRDLRPATPHGTSCGRIATGWESLPNSVENESGHGSPVTGRITVPHPGGMGWVFLALLEGRAALIDSPSSIAARALSKLHLSEPPGQTRNSLRFPELIPTRFLLIPHRPGDARIAEGRIRRGAQFAKCLRPRYRPSLRAKQPANSEGDASARCPARTTNDENHDFPGFAPLNGGRGTIRMNSVSARHAPEVAPRTPFHFPGGR
jgi:hypothetical protein